MRRASSDTRATAAAAGDGVLVDLIRSMSASMEAQPTGVATHLEPLADLRAVIFDVYGTLLISGSGDISLAREAGHSHAVTEALRHAGLKGRLDDAGTQAIERLHAEIERAHTRLREDGFEHPEVDIRDIWRAVLTPLAHHGPIRGDLNDERIACVAVAYECGVNPVWPMPGVRETLAELAAAGLVLGIVSNAQFYTPLTFEALLGASPARLGFAEDLCVWSWRAREAKPAPAMFERIAKTLKSSRGIRPEQALYVGNDMLNDICPAARVGMRTALFAGDHRSLRRRECDPRVAGLRPDRVVADLRQIPTMVVQQRGDTPS